MVKKSVKKIFVAILASLLVLVLLLALLFKLFGNQLIKTGVIAGSQKALKVDVSLEAVDLKVLAGEVDMKNMEIANPKGYKHPFFLKMGRAYMDLDVPTLMSDTIELETIRLDDIDLVIEQKGTTNNLKEILDNLPKSEAEETESKPTEEKSGKNLRIKLLEINNVKVRAELIPGIPGRADTVTLPPMSLRLENVGTNEKVNVADLMTKVITEISKGIAKKGAGLLPKDMVGSITDELGKQGEQLLKTGQEAGKELLENTKDIGKEATDAVKGIGDIFKKKEE